MPDDLIADQQGGLYNSTQNVSMYSRDEGFLVIPVMGPAGTAPKKVRVHAPVGYRTVRWAYSKRGTPPIVPAMVDTESGDEFLTGNLSLPVPYLGGANDHYDFSVSGEYTYVQNVSGSGARIAEYNVTEPKFGVEGQIMSPLGKFQSGRQPFKSSMLNASVIAAGAALVGGALAVLAQGENQDWPSPTFSLGSDATQSQIDFENGDYKYYDTTLSSLFFSNSLIV